MDELAGGVREAAWPAIRADLGLTYLQVGFLLGAPAVLGAVLEPLLGLLADTHRRRLLVIAGGVLFAASLAITSVSTGFWVLLVSFVLFYPASGAFVNISQAELMDRQPSRRDQNMARWTFAGSAGALAGPLALGLAGTVLGWRGLYTVICFASAAILAFAARVAFPRPLQREPGSARPRPAALRTLFATLRKREVIRWLVLLELANLMLDVLTGFLALYLVEVSSISAAQAALAVSLWTGAGLVGDFLVIPVLGRVPALRLLRAGAIAAAALYPCFLLAGPLAVKLVLVALLGLLRSGWYAVLQARLYEALPGQSGAALAVTTIAGSAGALVPVALGALAQAAGLPAAMWALLAAPLALLIGLPRGSSRR